MYMSHYCMYMSRYCEYMFHPFIYTCSLMECLGSSKKGEGSCCNSGETLAARGELHPSETVEVFFFLETDWISLLLVGVGNGLWERRGL